MHCPAPSVQCALNCAGLLGHGSWACCCRGLQDHLQTPPPPRAVTSSHTNLLFLQLWVMHPLLKWLKGTVVWRWVLDLLILIQNVPESDWEIAIKELFNLYAVAAAEIYQLNQNNNQIKLKIGPGEHCTDSLKRPWVGEWLNYNNDCRTSPDTPGLLKETSGEKDKILE